MKVITVINQKGGDGKTTIGCHLAYASDEAGLKTLVVDNDTQGNASQILTGDPMINRRPNGAEMLFKADVELPVTNPFGNVWLLHGHNKLDVVDRDPEILDMGVLASLRKRIAALGFDRVIFDAPPGVGPRQIGPLMWSDTVLIPVEPVPLSISGLVSLSDTISIVKRHNPSLGVRYVINRIHPSSKVQKANVEALRKRFGASILAELGLRVAVTDALAMGEPVWKRGSKQVKEAWRTFAHRALELNK